MKNTSHAKASTKAIKVFLLRMSFLMCSAAIFMLLTYYIPQNTHYEYTDSKSSAAHGEAAATEYSNACTLVLENGKLVIYSADGRRNVTDTDTESLTEYDIQLLSEGIHASYDEIYELLEAIGS